MQEERAREGSAMEPLPAFQHEALCCMISMVWVLQGEQSGSAVFLQVSSVLLLCPLSSSLATMNTGDNILPLSTMSCHTINMHKLPKEIVPPTMLTKEIGKPHFSWISVFQPQAFLIWDFWIYFGKRKGRQDLVLVYYWINKSKYWKSIDFFLVGF